LGTIKLADAFIQKLREVIRRPSSERASAYLTLDNASLLDTYRKGPIGGAGRPEVRRSLEAMAKAAGAFPCRSLPEITRRPPHRLRFP